MKLKRKKVELRMSKLKPYQLEKISGNRIYSTQAAKLKRERERERERDFLLIFPGKKSKFHHLNKC